MSLSWGTVNDTNLGEQAFFELIDSRREALQSLWAETSHAIARVRGVDVLFFGPSDFSILSGIPGEFDPEHDVRQALAVHVLRQRDGDSAAQRVLEKNEELYRRLA